ncbi:hypothetical protein OPV22_001400 [Ensete ventricosum]|uniref:Methionyl/Valyl/Leucyl/Isoleucyl-tRNA synthetase anticodon-binding domain-containing protein n=1 Tax=Ensete ventricosum TaxID=4639 RepID=A0AAV8QC74_ENSVE|nr:hypothetical protein OPV22_001400 [Ensete ventricosum]
MNHKLLWRFMDVQTRLMTPICPHYAEHVWKNILKDGFVVNAGWPLYDAPDTTLTIANKYLQDSIVLPRKLLQKQVSGPKKAKKGATIPAAEENKLTVGRIYVNEQFDGCKEECLRILQRNLTQRDALLHLVLQENSDLIKRQLGLEHVEVLSASDESCCHLFEQVRIYCCRTQNWSLKKHFGNFLLGKTAAGVCSSSFVGSLQNLGFCILKISSHRRSQTDVTRTRNLRGRS